MTTVNNRTLSGIISLSDGAGSTIENGRVVTNVVDSGHLITNTSEIGDLEIDRLWLQEHLQVDGLFITPTWLSYLYGLTSNVQTQISSISTTLLAGANTWTGAQTFSGNAVNLIFEKTSSLVPVQNSNSIGAIFGRNANSKALTFLNSSDNIVSNVIAFAWDKLGAGGGSVTTIASMTNSGGFTTAGNISAPNITTMTTNITNLQTDKQNVINTSNRLGAALVGTGIISNTEFNFLDGVTSSIQTQINGKQPTLSVSNRLDAALVGTGVVDNTEFGFLDGVTSAIQPQIDSKQPTISVSNRLDASLISTGVVSNTEFNTLDGVTSAIQPQIDSKQATLSISNRLDASLISTGVVSNTEFNTLDGVTSAIQPQIDSLVTSIASAAILTVANTWTAVQTWAVGNRIDILGSTANATWPTRASNGAGSIFCRGSTTYNMALSFINTNTNATSTARAFVWTKQTGVSSGVDLLRINNDGSAAFTGDVTVPTITFNRSQVAVDTINSDTTYTWSSLPTYTILTGSCNITLPYNSTALVPGATWNVTLRGNFSTTITPAGGGTIWYGGSSNANLVFASSNQSRTLFTNELGQWHVLLQ